MSAAAPDVHAQITALKEERMGGKITDRVFHERMSTLGPLSETAQPPALPATAPEAKSRIDALRQARLDGKVTESEFHRQMEALGPLSTPASPELSPQIQTQLDADMAPPSDPSGYRFEYSNQDPTPEHIAWDAKIRAGLHEIQLPQMMAAPIVRSVEALGTRFESATPEAIAEHQKQVRDALRAQWGDQFDSKIAAIDGLIESVKGELGSVLNHRPWLLADVQTLSTLDHFIQYRSARR